MDGPGKYVPLYVHSDVSVYIFIQCYQLIHDSMVLFLFVQSTNLVNFDPALLPIQPSDEVVNVSYGIQLFDPKSYETDKVISIVLDTPYNVRSVSIRLLDSIFAYM